MTICIATICENPQDPKIVFCADRLVTDANGLTFEQGNSKVDFIDDNCLVMSAGLASESDEIIRVVAEKVQKTSLEKEKNLRIKEIASFFKDEHQKLRKDKINDEILKPRGLSLDTFYKDIKNFPEWLAILLDNQISNYEFGVNFLVFGFDVLENNFIIPNIYKINKYGEMELLNKTGFGVIGIGDIMSLPEITKETYNTENTLSDAIVRTYWAKKSAERVVSVGKETTDLGLMWCTLEDDKVKVNNNWVTHDIQLKLREDFEKQSGKMKEMTTELQTNIQRVFTGEAVEKKTKATEKTD